MVELAMDGESLALRSGTAAQVILGIFIITRKYDIYSYFLQGRLETSCIFPPSP